MMTHFSQTAPPAVFASNTNLYTSASETIVLEDILVKGLKNIAITVNVYADSANTVSTVKLYGSADGVNYKQVTITVSSAAAGTVGHGEVTATWRYYRVTVTNAAHLDVFLDATL